MRMMTGDRTLDGIVSEMADSLDEGEASRLMELCDRLEATRSQRSRERQAEAVLREFPSLDGGLLLNMARDGTDRPGMLRVSMLFGLYSRRRELAAMAERGDLLERSSRMPLEDVTSWLR